MGNNEPESQSLGQWVQETAKRAKEPSASCKEEPVSHVGEGTISIQWRRAFSGQHGGRSVWCGAALWGAELSCLSSSGLKSASVIPLRVVYFMPWISRSVCWHPWWRVGHFPRSLSVGGPALQTQLFWSRVQISQACLFARGGEVVSVWNQSVRADWQSSWLTGVAPFYFIPFILTLTNQCHFIGPALHIGELFLKVQNPRVLSPDIWASYIWDGA